MIAESSEHIGAYGSKYFEQEINWLRTAVKGFR